MSLAESTRALDANADRIRTAQRTIQDLTEQIEELGDVRARLSALAPSEREPSADFVRLSRQQQLNQREISKLDSADRDLKSDRMKLSNSYKEKRRLRSRRVSRRSIPQMSIPCAGTMISSSHL